MDRIIVAALVLVGTVGPAFAGKLIQVPEPATMTLFGLGAGGAYLSSASSAASNNAAFEPALVAMGRAPAFCCLDLDTASPFSLCIHYDAACTGQYRPAAPGGE